MPSDWRRRINEAVRSARGLFLIADSGGEVVGNLGLWPDGNPASAHVAWIGMSVAAGWRGAVVGAGGALLEGRWSGPPRPASAAPSSACSLGNARAIAFYG